jgi:hypothetical protein
LHVFVDGIARWPQAAPVRADGATAGPAPGDGGAAAPAASHDARPAPALLAPNERRRASDGVLAAIEVAAAALADAAWPEGADLASVFTSSDGDLATTDALCRTLAQNPLLLSPTRFHHSVHNAASGYWAIARRSRAASTALAAGPYSVAAGLLEAASLCAADGAPVLLVASDTPAVGPLASVNASRTLQAAALLLRPDGGRWPVVLSVQAGDAPLPEGNPVGAAWRLLDVLAGHAAASCHLPLGPGLRLVVAFEGAAASPAGDAAAMPAPTPSLPPESDPA